MSLMNSFRTCHWSSISDLHNGERQVMTWRTPFNAVKFLDPSKLSDVPFRFPIPIEQLRMVTSSRAEGGYCAPKKKTGYTSGSSNQRDKVNFPDPVALERNPPVRLGFIPKSWFDFVYPITGVTGGYMLMIGLIVFALSKEYWVWDPEANRIAPFVTVFFVVTRYAPEIKEFFLKEQEKFIKNLDETQQTVMNMYRQEIKDTENQTYQAECLSNMLPEAKRENVYLQLEGEYRSRIQQYYETVKQTMDYHVMRSDLQLFYMRRNLSQWVLKAVDEAITPDLKATILKEAISELKSLLASK